MDRTKKRGSTSQTTTVLVIEDDAQVRRLLRINLEKEGCRVIEAATGQDGIDEAIGNRVQAILLGMELPDMAGLMVLLRLREWIKAPIIAMTSRPNEDDIIMTLDNGANDVIAKPFSPRELLARLRAARRHVPAAEERYDVFRCGPLMVDLSRRLVKIKERRVPLTVTEYSLLHLFVKHAGKVLTHTQILREIWGPEGGSKVVCLRVYLTHLRGKLEPNPSKPQLLLTEPGVGYRQAFPG